MHHHGRKSQHHSARRKDPLGSVLVINDFQTFQPEVIVKGDVPSRDIVPLLREAFAFVASYEGEVPGATARDCGNYLLMNLPEAQWEARKYLSEVLDNISEENLNYPE